MAPAPGNQMAKASARKKPLPCGQMRKGMSGPVHISKASLKRVVREVLSEYVTEARMTRDAYCKLQEIVEGHLTDMFRSARLVLNRTGRHRCTAEDLKLVKDILAIYHVNL